MPFDPEENARAMAAFGGRPADITLPEQTIPLADNGATDYMRDTGPREIPDGVDVDMGDAAGRMVLDGVAKIAPGPDVSALQELARTRSAQKTQERAVQSANAPAPGTGVTDFLGITNPAPTKDLTKPTSTGSEPAAVTLGTQPIKTPSNGGGRRSDDAAASQLDALGAGVNGMRDPDGAAGYRLGEQLGGAMGANAPGIPQPERPQTLAELRASVTDAPNRMGQILANANNNAADRRMAEALYLEEQAQKAEARVAAANAARAAQQAKQDAQLAKVQAASEDAKNFQIADGGFLQRNPGAVLQAIGAVFGGMLSARTGQPNAALQSLENSIQRDIDGQRAKYEQKKAFTGDQNNVYAMMRQRGLDDDQARLVAEADARRAVADKLGAMHAQHGAQDMKDSSAAIVEQYRSRAEQLKFEAGMMGAAKPAVGVGGGGAKTLKGQEFVPGFGVYLPAEEARDLKKKLVEFDTIESTADTIAKYYESTNGITRLMDRDKRNQIANLGRKLAVAVKKKAETGASLTEYEKEFLEVKPEDSQKIFDIFSEQPGIFKAVADSARADRETLRRNYGGVSGSPTAVSDGVGGVAIKDKITGLPARPAKGVASVGKPRQ